MVTCYQPSSSCGMVPSDMVTIKKMMLMMITEGGDGDDRAKTYGKCNDTLSSEVHMDF